MDERKIRYLIENLLYAIAKILMFLILALEWAVENDSQLILNDKRVQVVIEVSNGD